MSDAVIAIIVLVLAVSGASISLIAIWLCYKRGPLSKPKQQLTPPVEPTPVEKVFDKLVAEIERSPDWNFVDVLPQLARFSNVHNWKQDFYLVLATSSQVIYLLLPTSTYETEVRTLLQDIYGDRIPEAIKVMVAATPSV